MYLEKNLNKLLQKAFYTDIDISNKTVLVRSCLNVTTNEEGKVIDRTRFDESLPLIKDLIQKAKKVIITAHLGRPETEEKKFSFWNVAELFNEEFKEVTRDGKQIKVQLVRNLEDIPNVGTETEYTIILVDNIRFFKEEESKDLEIRKAFAKKLAGYADIFINDAFADYRESASTYDIAEFLPSYIGPLFYKEVEALSSFSNPKKPFIAVLGGAKLSEKLDVLHSLLEVADKVIIGGAMAYTLLRAQGVEIGNSRFEEDKLSIAEEIITKAGDKLMLPIDHVVIDTFKEPAENECSVTEDVQIPKNTLAVDIGPKTIQLFSKELSNAGSILVNGPMGVFEWDATSTGTKSVLQAIVSNRDAYELGGGGDTIASINKFNISGFDHICTGGGAMLAFLAYEEFPVLDVILDQHD